jgi:hypothetical protein
MHASSVFDAAGLRQRLPSLDPGFIETADFRGERREHYTRW